MTKRLGSPQKHKLQSVIAPGCIILVMPAKAGIHSEFAKILCVSMDPSFRWGDGEERLD
jgi:hypothetical protein